jgi:hypothetical protein
LFSLDDSRAYRSYSEAKCLGERSLSHRAVCELSDCWLFGRTTLSIARVAAECAAEQLLRVGRKVCGRRAANSRNDVFGGDRRKPGDALKLIREKLAIWSREAARNGTGLRATPERKSKPMTVSTMMGTTMLKT